MSCDAVGDASPDSARLAWCCAALSFLLAASAGGCGQVPDADEGDAAVADAAHDVGADVGLAIAGDVGAQVEPDAAADAVAPDLGPTPACAVDGLACDDGDPCTMGDRCQAGACSPGPDLCACHESADCPAANPCLGPVICDQAALPWACRQLTAQPVVCSGAKDTWCAANSCDPETGACTVKAHNQGAPCATGDICLQGTICDAGQCGGGQNVCGCANGADCVQYDGVDLCAGSHFCDGSVFPAKCAINPATVISCSAAKDTACSVNGCQSKTGTCAMVAVPDGVVCDDGDACTNGDGCAGGVCAGGQSNVCTCSSDADCGAKDDGDLCNGTQYCDLATGACKENPASVVTCPSVNDSTCLKNVCYPAAGICQATPVEKAKLACADGDKDCHWVLLASDATGTTAAVPCDDGKPCSADDVCAGGECMAGTDTCACSKDGDCAKLDDGDLCNGTMYCNQATKQCMVNPSSQVSCPSVDDTDCSKNTCVPKTGLCATAPVADNLPCDDDNPCTTGQTCKAGKCGGGADICLCKSNEDCAGKDDGNLCNGSLYCHGQTHMCVLNPASVVSCPTSNDTLCLKNACQPATGKCVPTALEKTKEVCEPVDGKKACAWQALGPAELPAAASLCDDGNLCTQGDLCQGGTCVAGANTCECWKDEDCAVKEDGNACNGTLFCDKSGAKPKCALNPASVVVCNKDYPGPCVGDLCNPATGKCAKGPVNDGTPCDDGTLCTVADTCAAGKCVGKPADCDDKDQCTNDSCQPDKGCLHTPPICDDGNSCTHDGCDPQTGKCFADPSLNNGKLCNADNNGCTVNDACSWGVCKMGVQIVCNLPLKDCQQAICVPDTATKYHCMVNAAPDGTDCDDGVACTVGSACLKGKCSGVGKERFFTKTYAPPLEHGSLTAVAVHGNGDLVAVGGTWQGSGSSAKNHAWWILRTDPAGGQQWSEALKGSVNNSLQQAGAVALLGASDSLVGGGLWTQAGGIDFHLARYTKAGALVWSKTLTEAKSNEAIGSVLVDKYGGITAAGQRSASGRTGLRVVQVSAIGLQVWALNYHDSGLDHFLGQSLRRDDGSLLIVGTRKDPANGQEHGLLLPISVAGQVGEPTLLGQGNGNSLAAVARLGGGELMVGGRQCPASSFCSWFVGLDSDLNARWQSPPQSGVHVAGLVATGKLRIATAAWSQPAGAKATMLGRGLDRWSNTQWQRSLGGGGGTKAHAIADGGGGDAVLVGDIVDGKLKGRIARLDAFGKVSCADAATCLSKAESACDDGNDCTIDSCDAKAVCKHAVVEKLLCDAKDTCSEISTCSKGACQPTATGRLWYYSSPLGDGAGNHVHGGSAVTSDGGYAQTGQAKVGGAHRAFVRRLDGKGKLRWNQTINYGGTGHGASLIAADKGAVIALVRLAPTTGGPLGALRRIEADGKVGWTRADSWLKTQLPWGLVVGDSGSFYAIVTNNTYHGGTVYLRRLAANGSVISQSSGATLGYYTQSTPYIPAANAQNVTTGGLLWGPRGVRHADGGVSVAVTRKTHLTGSKPPKQRGWLGHWNSGGGLVWTWGTAYNEGYNYSLIDVEDRAAGGVIAGGARGAGSVASGWLFALDKNGKPLWEKLWTGLGYGIDAIAELPGGDIAAGGWKMSGGKQVMWMAQFTPAGTTAWQRTWSDAHGFVHEIEPLPGGDLMIGFAPGMTWRATLGRTDAWGTAACDQTGKCIKLKVGGCDDKNKCTADWCSATKGCQHTSLPGC